MAYEFQKARYDCDRDAYICSISGCIFTWEMFIMDVNCATINALYKRVKICPVCKHCIDVEK